MSRRQEHQLLEAEQARMSAIAIEKQKLEEKLASILKKASGINTAFTGSTTKMNVVGFIIKHDRHIWF